MLTIPNGFLHCSFRRHIKKLGYQLGTTISRKAFTGSRISEIKNEWNNVGFKWKLNFPVEIRSISDSSGNSRSKFIQDLEG